MSRQVVVLGTPRSGTSMVAGVLHRLGVNMGHEMIPTDEHNPTGYYEDAEFVRINKLILKTAGGSWRNPPSHEAIMAVSQCDAQMAALVDKRDHGLWGWKDPRTCLTLCHWLPLLNAPEFVVVWRHWPPIIKSLCKRSDMQPKEAEGLCVLYEDRLNIALADEQEIVAMYEWAIREPGPFVANLADAFGIDTTPEAIAFIDPSLDHSRCE